MNGAARIPAALLALATSALWLGCASYPATPRLEAIDKSDGYRFDRLQAPDNDPSLFVILTFSGGGTRAAAYSYGVLEKLRDTSIVVDGKERTLLDEVDVISSVSGGSFTAAYYGLFGNQIFDSYLDDFLYVDIQAKLMWALFSPVNWFKLMSPTYGRIELASEIYDRQVFGGKHFEDLSKKAELPFLMINATDVSRGSPFTFTQGLFDALCSDLDGMKVARAVAASSNFPIAFTPLTVNNYAGSCDYAEPAWVRNGMKDLLVNPARFQRATTLRSYQDSKDRPYLHLLDGGVSDNIGLRGPLVSLQSNDVSWSVVNQVNDKKLQRVVVIIVDAKTAPADEMDRSASPPGLVDVVNAIATIPMENFSFDTVQALRRYFVKWNNDQKIAAQVDPKKAPAKVSLYPIYLGFERIENPDERHEFQNMPTSFKLEPEQVDSLRKLGGQLLEESKHFQKLLSDLQ